jgi:hypothetical protein
MHGGERQRWVAYVGIADNLKRRIDQHLVKRDSSVTTGTTAVGLHSEHVREVVWWEHPDFTDRHVLHAAELVAFATLDPALRSRGGVSSKAREHYERDQFQNAMRRVFEGPPTGRLVLPSLATLSERVAALERRLAQLDNQTGKPRRSRRSTARNDARDV